MVNLRLLKPEGGDGAIELLINWGKQHSVVERFGLNDPYLKPITVAPESWSWKKIYHWVVFSRILDPYSAPTIIQMLNDDLEEPEQISNLSNMSVMTLTKPMTQTEVTVSASVGTSIPHDF